MTHKPLSAPKISLKLQVTSPQSGQAAELTGGETVVDFTTEKFDQSEAVVEINESVVPEMNENK